MAQALVLLGLSLFYYPDAWCYNGIVERLRKQSSMRKEVIIR